ncbi:4-hydroxybenzoate octaprenyltransferase [Sphingomonas sp. Leaf24]|uniref:4-hydroxybenzoate octaprenyltransferase n=1 Tax=unclassified Sphingomonas TaxID=196159 RepID=UPI0006FC0DDC|nr:MULTISPECIES: 4-hydroxybenzoate octaprenyltransferase [unclassified Sphingomonas]KQM17153.1 4-hydroxybenzoate octaprenyltransferase [Sphingomonas sp. Leaf5]KQM76835.1 4-hydroxybenzoate octaprenyltransferase [Sphingomonas sp. Leaf22]KQM88046.1 4-hydroxybenzoate octaprenyltransferase [Sphingomonas sp. Leaf24]
MPSPTNAAASEQVADTEHRGMIAVLPRRARPFALLARFDRPIGWWLLYWPGAWAMALSGRAVERWDMLLWFLLGSVAMRGAGCVYNDIVDRDLDRQVARTANRPLASGAVSVKAAWVWLLVLSLIGLVVLLQLNLTAAIVALASLALVAAYPFMKRITWWPQAWLGMVFSWAAPVAWAQMGTDDWLPLVLLYAGSIAWVIGYDTIYACQDIEDDAMVGVRSSARAMGSRVRPGVTLLYAVAIACWAGAVWRVFPTPLALAALLPGALHLLWQVATLKPADGANTLRRFRSNRDIGLLLFLGLLVVGQAA